ARGQRERAGPRGRPRDGRRTRAVRPPAVLLLRPLRPRLRGRRRPGLGPHRRRGLDGAVPRGRGLLPRGQARAWRAAVERLGPGRRGARADRVARAVPARGPEGADHGRVRPGRSPLTRTPSRASGVSYVLDLREIDRTQVALVGGKGAHLGEPARIGGVRVPAGCCVTTDAFRRIVEEAPSFDDHLDRLSRLRPDDREAIGALSAEIRRLLEGIAIPDDLEAALTRALARLGERAAYAVRSSATAEDSPTASFAGQHGTYLDVVGPAAVLEHVRRCWASLFTERAVTCRLLNGFDHRKVHMAVVVQRMVFPQAAGILFTADPVTGNRKVTSVEA